MPKVKLIGSEHKAGKSGDVIEVSAVRAARWKKRGWATDLKQSEPQESQDAAPKAPQEEKSKESKQPQSTKKSGNKRK